MHHSVFTLRVSYAAHVKLAVDESILKLCIHFIARIIATYTTYILLYVVVDECMTHGFGFSLLLSGWLDRGRYRITEYVGISEVRTAYIHRLNGMGLMRMRTLRIIGSRL